jgi:hypothetical protein
MPLGLPSKEEGIDKSNKQNGINKTPFIMFSPFLPKIQHEFINPLIFLKKIRTHVNFV